MDLETLEAALLGLIRGEHSSIHLTYNDGNGPNYETVAEEEEGGHGHGRWISEEERQKAMRENSKWVLQWYPVTPVGFYAIAASSLPALFKYIHDKRDDFT